jgi:hypothetical protein
MYNLAACVKTLSSCDLLCLHPTPMIHPTLKHYRYAYAYNTKPIIDYLESTWWIFMENSFNKYRDVNKEAPSANNKSIPSYTSHIFQTQKLSTSGVSTTISVHKEFQIPWNSLAQKPQIVSTHGDSEHPSTQWRVEWKKQHVNKLKCQ